MSTLSISCKLASPPPRLPPSPWFETSRVPSPSLLRPRPAGFRFRSTGYLGNFKSAPVIIFQIVYPIACCKHIGNCVYLILMDIQYYIQVLPILCIYFLWITARACKAVSLTSAYDKVDSCNPSPEMDGITMSSISGCLPYSQLSLLSLLLEKHATNYNSDFQALLAQEFSKHNSCGKLLYNSRNIFSLSAFKRHLIGEVIVESLPTGVFADSFELQHLVHRGVLLDAAVFGDTNLELPSALSNQSLVKLHLNIRDGGSLEEMHITSELPLHARYPPLDASGYSRVEINPPDVLMLCKPKLLQHDSLSVIISWNARCAQKVVWNIPSGNQALFGIVSAVTFTSALVSALVIVYTAAFCSLSKDTID